jgi:hypothetical protein
MPIKNYTTSVDAAKTCGEISGLLAAKGARRIQMEYDDHHQPIALSFTYAAYGFPVFFQLPCNIDGVEKCLRGQKGVGFQYQNREHARKVAWRILKNWVEAQIAIVEAGAAQMVEVFLPYAVQQDGKTMFELFNENYAQKQLTTQAAEEIA